MKYKITETSEQYEMRKAATRRDNSCPRCGSPSLGSYSTQTKGLFNIKTKKTYYNTCIHCHTSWEVEGDWE